ncbi:MAG: hypothetical protein QOI78_6544, partial [Actinomycetota bacterium]|nr:hypothetical protein [Actinomycetota bacterium]
MPPRSEPPAGSAPASPGTPQTAAPGPTGNWTRPNASPSPQATDSPTPPAGSTPEPPTVGFAAAQPTPDPAETPAPGLKAASGPPQPAGRGQVTSSEPESPEAPRRHPAAAGSVQQASSAQAPRRHPAAAGSAQQASSAQAPESSGARRRRPASDSATASAQQSPSASAADSAETPALGFAAAGGSGESARVEETPGLGLAAAGGSGESARVEETPGLGLAAAGGSGESARAQEPTSAPSSGESAAPAEDSPAARSRAESTRRGGEAVKPASKSAAKQASPRTSATKRPAEPPREEPPITPWADDHIPTPQLTTALALLALGAVALTAAAFVPVSPAASPGFTSWPWLAVLALGPVVVAVAMRGKPGVAAGVVLGLAALAPGRLVLDLQFAVNGPLTIRPELYLPDRFLGGSTVGAGFWLLVAGDVLTAGAGVLAWRAVRARDEEPERRRWRLLVPLLAVAASVGVLTAPVHSDNGFLLARAAFEGPWPALGGYLLLAAALPFAAVLALAAPSERVARGALGGLAAAAFGIALPPVVAGLSRDDLHVAWGPVLVLVAMVAVAGLAGTRLTETSKVDAENLAGGAKLPGLFWWRLTTGVLGLATALAAVIGTLAPQVAVTALNPAAAAPVSAAAESPARWFLLAAAIVVAVLSLGVLVTRTAPAARSLLGLAWAGIVLAGTAVLNTALTATQAGNLAGFGGADLNGASGAQPAFTYDLGAGAAWTFAALVLAVLAALAAAGTGVVEREDAGDGSRPNGGVLTPVVAGAVLAVAAFGLPVFTVPGYVAPGLWSNFDTPSWGLLTAAAVVVGAAVLALRSRPKQAAALLVGAALLAVLHAAELPLVGGSLGGASPATGFWVALAAAVALLKDPALTPSARVLHAMARNHDNVYVRFALSQSLIHAGT